MLSVTMGRSKFLIEKLGIRVVVVAQLAGLSATRLADALRDDRALADSAKEAELLTLVSKLARFQTAIAPLQLPENRESLQTIIDSSVEPDELAAVVKKIFDNSSTSS